MRVNKDGKSSNKVIFILWGKMKCGYCGSNVIGESGISRTGAHMHYYKCGNKKKNRLNCSRACAYKKDVLEKLIADITLPQSGDLFNNSRL